MLTETALFSLEISGPKVVENFRCTGRFGSLIGARGLRLQPQRPRGWIRVCVSRVWIATLRWRYIISIVTIYLLTYILTHTPNKFPSVIYSAMQVYRSAGKAAGSRTNAGLHTATYRRK